MAKKVENSWNLGDSLFSLEEKIEAKYNESPLHLDEDFNSSKISTGCLMLDMVIGGGLGPGTWITLYGMESSGKSTCIYQILKSLIELKVSKVDFYDYENSLATQYFVNIMGRPLKDIVGQKNSQGEWTILPKVRHYMPEYGEVMFKMVASKMRNLPDNIVQGGMAYNRFDKEAVKSLAIPEEYITFKRDKYSYIEDNGLPVKYVAFVDSLPEMLPQALYENTDNNPMAQQARMFSNGIPLIRPSMRRKGVVVITINHIRLKPGVSFGNPEYTPGGKHIDMVTDIKLRVAKTVIPEGKSYIEEEENLDGEIERYAYTKITVKKNKKAQTLGESCTLRLCIQKAGVEGYGIDPVFDLLEYLKTTKQITKRGDTIKITLPGLWENIKLTWNLFRTLIHKPLDTSILELLLANETKKDPWSEEKHKAIEAFQKIAAKENPNFDKLKDLLDIRKACFQQIQTREAFKLKK